MILVIQLLGIALCLNGLRVSVQMVRRVKRWRAEDAEHLDAVVALLHHVIETHEPADTELRWHADWLELQAERAHIFAGHRDAEIKRMFRHLRHGPRRHSEGT